MFLKEFLADYYATLYQRCGGLLLPFLGEVERYADGVLFGCDSRHLRLGEHAQRGFAACKRRGKLVGGGVGVVKRYVFNLGAVNEGAENELGV